MDVFIRANVGVILAIGLFLMVYSMTTAIIWHRFMLTNAPARPFSRAHGWAIMGLYLGGR